MGNNDTINNQKITSVKSVKKSHWKIYLYLFVLIIILAMLGYIYVLRQIKQSNEYFLDNMTAEIQQQDLTIKKYAQLKAGLNQEKTRCEIYINQGEGEFDEFEYCKRIVEWIDGLGM